MKKTFTIFLCLSLTHLTVTANNLQQQESTSRLASTALHTYDCTACARLVAYAAFLEHYEDKNSYSTPKNLSKGVYCHVNTKCERTEKVLVDALSLVENRINHFIALSALEPEYLGYKNGGRLSVGPREGGLADLDLWIKAKEGLEEELAAQKKAQLQTNLRVKQENQ